MEILVLVVSLVVFDVAALRWGANSADGVYSPEWERRRRWPAFRNR